MNTTEAPPRMSAREAFAVLGEAARERHQAQAERDRRRNLTNSEDLRFLEAAYRAIASDAAEAETHAAALRRVANVLDEHVKGWRVRLAKTEAAERKRVRTAPVEVELATVDGCEVVRVPLFGKHAGGRTMTLDAVSWSWIAPTFGTRWTVARIGPRELEYVVTTCRSAVRTAKRLGYLTGSAPIVPLARIIADVRRSERIAFRNADRLDLRLRNIEVSKRGDQEEARARETATP